MGVVRGCGGYEREGGGGGAGRGRREWGRVVGVWCGKGVGGVGLVRGRGGLEVGVKGWMVVVCGW